MIWIYIATRSLPNRYIHSCALCLTISGLLLALTPDAGQAAEPGTIGLYELVERTFVSKTRWPNGFLDVDVDVTFTHDDTPTQALTLPAFWNGKDETGRDRFSVRFAPTKLGPWRYRTHSAQDRSLDGLDGPEGTAETLYAVPSQNPGFMERSGPFHFRTSDGTRFFPVGTTAYEWVGSQSADSPALDYVVQFIKKHFNKVRFSYMSTRLDDNAFGGRRRLSDRAENGYFWYSDVTEVDSRFINPQHWAKLDRIVAKLQQAGVQADLILARTITRSAQVQGNWLRGVAGPPSTGTYIGDKGLRYFVGRYAAYSNLWWCIANEYPEAALTPGDVTRIAQRLRALDPYSHPLTVHWNEDWLFGGQEWASHGNLQAHIGDFGITGLNDNIAKLRTRHRIAFINEEYGYEEHENRPNDPENVVKAHWALVLGGGYGGYGHGPARLVGKHMWAGVDRYWRAEPSSKLPWRLGRYWQAQRGPTSPPASVLEVAQGQDAAASLGYMRDWMNGGHIGYWRMTPANHLVSSDAADAFCLAAEGREYLASGQGGTVEIDLSAAAGKDLPVEELDPMSGAVRSLGGTGGATRYRHAIPKGRFLLIHIGDPE